MTNEIMVLSPMTVDEARQATEKIKSNQTESRRLLLDVYERDGWKALGYKNIAEYAEREFEYKKAYTHFLINAAEVERNLRKSTKVDNRQIPETHLRPLATLPADVQPKAYQQAVDTAPNGKVTAAHVEHIVKEYKQEIEQPESDEPFLPDDENRVLYEDPAPEAEQVELSGFDPSIHQAYCKYCYQTHSDWEASADHSEPAWYCERCEHATADRFLDFEPVPEQGEEGDKEAPQELDDFEKCEKLMNAWWDAEHPQTREKYRKELWNTMVKIDRERGGY